MNTPAGEIKQRSCPNCGYFGETAETICPQCTRPLQTTTSTRIRGFLMILCGVFLVGMVGYISLWALEAVNTTSSSGSRFTGTGQEKLMIFGLFGLLMVFGLGSFVTGLYQLISGRRNKVLAWSVAGLGILIFIGGGAIAFFLD